jgi:hypothetical protein
LSKGQRSPSKPRFGINWGIFRVIGKAEDAKKFRKLIAMDEYADNCAAELGMGTNLKEA